MTYTTQIDDIPHMVASVRAHFATHITKSLSWRRTQLRALQTMLNEHEKDIAEALKKDLGKPWVEGAFSEVWMVQTELQTMIRDLASWTEDEVVPTPLALLPGKSYIHKEPFGVALISGPFNYPIQLVLLPLAAALAAGNCAIIKPSEVTPASSELLQRLIPRFLDNRAVRVVEGGIAQAAALLKERWDFIFFTGSETVGKIYAKAAAEHLTPIVLELGGKSPVIVDKTADIEVTAKRILHGKFFNAGQTCVAPDYVYVHRDIKQRFIDAAKSTLQSFYGDNVKSSPDYGRIVSEKHAIRLDRIIKAHQSDIIAGGDVDITSRFVAPTLLSLDAVRGEAMKEEIFGPILPIIEFTNVEEVIEHINANPKPLALYVFTKNNTFFRSIIDKTSSGGICKNETVMHLANSDLPFGGVGNSGMGSYHGKAGFDAFSHKRAVLEKSTTGDAPVRYPPYSTGNASIMKFVGGITSVNSVTFSNAFKYLAVPAVSAMLLHQLGVRVHFSLVD